MARRRRLPMDCDRAYGTSARPRAHLMRTRLRPTTWRAHVGFHDREAVPSTRGSETRRCGAPAPESRGERRRGTGVAQALGPEGRTAARRTAERLAIAGPR